jgi:prophage tail gpP-like protein
VRLEVDGQTFGHFTAATVEVEIDALARTFEFAAATRGVGDIPFRPGQACAVWIDEDRVLTGWVERVEVEVGENAEEVVVRVAGRDRMADIVDSNLDGLGESGSTMAAVARSVLRFLGVEAEVVDLSGSAARPFDAASEIAAPDATETAAEYLWSLAARRQVLLSSDGDGNLVVQNGAPEPIAAKLVHRADGEGNNLVAMRFEADHAKRFHLYRVTAQANVAASAFSEVDLAPSDVATVKGEHRDSRVRASRRRTIAGEATYTAGDARVRARWEANLARAEGLVYQATVPTWRDPSGALWRVNTSVEVEDEFAGISSRLMISGLRFEDAEGGPSTTIVLRRLDAYTSQAALTEIEARAQAAKDAADGADEEGQFSAAELEALVIQ